MNISIYAVKGSTLSIRINMSTLMGILMSTQMSILIIFLMEISTITIKIIMVTLMAITDTTIMLRTTKLDCSSL